MPENLTAEFTATGKERGRLNTPQVTWQTEIVTDFHVILAFVIFQPFLFFRIKIKIHWLLLSKCAEEFASLIKVERFHLG